MDRKLSVSASDLSAFVAECIRNDVVSHSDIMQEIDEQFADKEIPFTYILTEQLPIDAHSNGSVVFICTDRRRAGQWVCT